MKTVLVLALILFMASCASIKADQNTGIVEYKRFGNQELHAIVIQFEKTPDGKVKLKASLGEQKSEREIAEVLLSFSRNLDKALQILMEIQAKFPSLGL